MTTSNVDSLNQLFARLEATKAKRLPAELKKCIDKPMLNNMINRILNDEALKSDLQKLKPNEALYLNKHQTKLDRTFKIARNPNGKYICVLETKSKDNQNKKRKIKIYGGGYKKGKDAWRIDGAFQPYLSLKITLAKKPQALKRLSAKIKDLIAGVKKEVAFPWKFSDAKHFHRSILGPLYNNKKGLHFNVLTRKKTTLKDALKILTKAQKDSITEQLLVGLDYIHEKGYIHQDINPSNILIEFDAKNQVKATFNDFGGTVQHREKSDVFGTIGYESPQTAAIACLDTFAYRHYYKKHYKKNGPTLAKTLSTHIKLTEATKKEYMKPHPANDVWALGVTLFILYCKQKPKALPKSPLLAALLNPDREKRITAAQARALWQGMTHPNEESAFAYCLRPAKTFTAGFFSFINSASTHISKILWGKGGIEAPTSCKRYSHNL